jgi:hypothetical protein
MRQIIDIDMKLRIESNCDNITSSVRVDENNFLASPVQSGAIGADYRKCNMYILYIY